MNCTYRIKGQIIHYLTARTNDWDNNNTTIILILSPMKKNKSCPVAIFLNQWMFPSASQLHVHKYCLRAYNTGTGQTTIEWNNYESQRAYLNKIFQSIKPSSPVEISEPQNKASQSQHPRTEKTLQASFSAPNLALLRVIFNPYSSTLLSKFILRMKLIS